MKPSKLSERWQSDERLWMSESNLRFCLRRYTSILNLSNIMLQGQNVRTLLLVEPIGRVWIMCVCQMCIPAHIQQPGHNKLCDDDMLLGHHRMYIFHVDPWPDGWMFTLNILTYLGLTGLPLYHTRVHHTLLCGQRHMWGHLIAAQRGGVLSPPQAIHAFEYVALMEHLVRWLWFNLWGWFGIRSHEKAAIEFIINRLCHCQSIVRGSLGKQTWRKQWFIHKYRKQVTIAAVAGEQQCTPPARYDRMPKRAGVDASLIKLHGLTPTQTPQIFAISHILLPS